MRGRDGTGGGGAVLGRVEEGRRRFMAYSGESGKSCWLGGV